MEMRSDQSFAHLPSRWRLVDQPLFIQFLFSAGFVAIFCFLSLGVLLLQVKHQSDAAQEVSVSHQVIGRLNRLTSQIYRERDLVFHAQKERSLHYLGKIADSRQSVEESFKFLDSLVTDHTPLITHQEGALEKAHRFYKKWIKAVGDGLSAFDLQDEELLLRDTLIHLDRVIDGENRILDQRREDDRRQSKITFILIAVINLTLLFGFGIVISRLYFSIAQPLFQLQAGLKNYQDGNFKVRVSLSSRSEIGFLQLSFNKMAEEIEQLVSDLRKLDELKTEFLSTVSHELRTPLTSIGGYVKLLVSGDAGSISDTQKEFLKIIDTNVDRLTHLINDILDVEAIESGKVQLDREPQDLIPILRECSDTFKIVAIQKGLDFRVRLPRQLRPVLGDRERLVQVFMNLVSNAIKYTPSGFIEIEAEENDLAVVIRVQDSGVGLSEEEQERLFQKFYRTRSGLSSTEGGTGLGLVIARGWVEALGGQISVESEKGKGTVFTVTLPLISQSHRVSKEVAEKQVIPSSLEQKRTIWVIDSNLGDVEKIIRYTKILESSSGFRVDVRSFLSLQDLPQSPQETPSIIIVDTGGGESEALMIPQLRKQVSNTVPILAICTAVDTALALAEGASAILTQPLGEGEFIIALRDLLTTKDWRVLVADYNTDQRILLKRALENRGIYVDDVDHGHLVLGKLEQENYDLVVLDIHLPDVSGLELLKVIRNNADFDFISVFLTGEGNKQNPHGPDLSFWKDCYFMLKQEGMEKLGDTIFNYLEERKSNG